MAALVCPEGSTDLITGRNLMTKSDPVVVKLRVPGGKVECFDFETIYGLLKETITSNKPFISPYTRAPYTPADRTEIERVRKIYVAANLEEAPLYPSLENLVAGEVTLNDAAEAIEEISNANPADAAAARARLDRILSRGIISKTTVNPGGETLYYYAIVAGLPDLVSRFKTPEGFITTDRGYTPFLLACEMRKFSIIKLVAPDPADAAAVNAVIGGERAPAPVVVAAAYNRKEESAAILEWLFTTYRYNINITDGNGNTPLTVAIVNSNIPVFKYLTTHGADANVLTKSYDSPLMLAAREGNQEMVRTLLTLGAKMYINDKTGESAFSIAQAKATTSSANTKSRFTALVEMLRSVPVTHIDGVNRPNNFVQITPAERARRIAAIAAAQRRGLAAAAPKSPAVMTMRNRQKLQEASLKAKRDAAVARRGTASIAVRQLAFPRTGSGRKTRRHSRGRRQYTAKYRS